MMLWQWGCDEREGPEATRPISNTSVWWSRGDGILAYVILNLSPNLVYCGAFGSRQEFASLGSTKLFLDWKLYTSYLTLGHI